MALTLPEAAKIALGKDEILKATIMEIYAKSSDILRVIPFENISGNAISFNREATLGDVGFRDFNQAYVEGVGSVDRITESLRIAGGDIDVDVALVKTHGADQRSVQERLKIKALALAITRTMVKGDTVTIPLEFDGLQLRCEGDQLISAGTTDGGDALSLSKIDELIDQVEDPTHLLMNKGMRRRLTQAARNTSVGGFITYDKDQFGRTVTKYNDLPILIADKDNTNSPILPFNEAAEINTGASLSTSIYCASFTENGICGLQNDSMDVRDLGEIDAKPVFRTRVDWLVSMVQFGHRALGRLYGITDSAVVA